MTKIDDAGVDPAVVAEIDRICSAIEAYFLALKGDGRLNTYDSLEGEPAMRPQPAEEIDAFEAEFSLRLPDEVRAFLRRGLRCATYTLNEPWTEIGVDFHPDMGGHAEHVKMMRGVAAELDPNDYEPAYLEVLTQGTFLNYAEPEFAVIASGPNAGMVYHFSVRNDTIPMTDSFTTFLEHWLAAGCHRYGDFEAIWPIVRDLVPDRPSRKDNVWLQYYDKQYNTNYAR